MIQSLMGEQHRQAINLVIWYPPQDFDTRCEQALQILSDAGKVAEGIDKTVWADLQDTIEKIDELRKLVQILDKRHLGPKEQKDAATRKATIQSELISKLQRI